MRLYPLKTPFFIPWIYRRYKWTHKGHGKKIYLTFDDGPTSELNPFICETLGRYNVNATFFCVGENLENNPKEAQRLIDEGHILGNHTFNHRNGWKTSDSEYFDNMEKCEKALSSFGIDRKLFRPPYGKIRSSQGREILSRGYEIIMWDVITGDFDPSMQKEKVLSNAIRNSRPGSIVIFHDNIKGSENLKYALPLYLDEMTKRGYEFDLI